MTLWKGAKVINGCWVPIRRTQEGGFHFLSVRYGRRGALYLLIIVSEPLAAESHQKDQLDAVTF